MKKLKANDSIYLSLIYVDSTGETKSYAGTGVIHNNSLMDPTNIKHQIRLTINFPGLNISNKTFRIQPQYGNIYVDFPQLLNSDSQPISNIRIKTYNDIAYKPINDNFISNNIARVSDIPTRISQFDNDSGFITSDALTGYATKTYVEEGVGRAKDYADKMIATTTSNMMTTDTAQDIICPQSAGKTFRYNVNSYGFALSAYSAGLMLQSTGYAYDQIEIRGTETDCSVSVRDSDGHRVTVGNENTLDRGLSIVDSINSKKTIYAASYIKQDDYNYNLPNSSGTLALTSDVTAVDSKNTFQTTAPTQAITDGGIHIVYLSSEPATKYDGYIYLIAE